jgi:hypothetical protein
MLTRLAGIGCSMGFTKNLTFPSYAPANSPVLTTLGPFIFPHWQHDIANASSDGVYPRAIYKVASDANEPALVLTALPFGVSICSMAVSSYTTNGTLVISGKKLLASPPTTVEASVNAYPQPTSIDFDATWMEIRSISMLTIGLRGPSLWELTYSLI